MSVHRYSAIGALCLLLGCGGTEKAPDGLLTWEQFVSRISYDGSREMFLLNGDEVARDMTEVREVYQRYLDGPRAPSGRFGTSRQELIVNVKGNKDDVWTASEALALTYCVDAVSFGTNYPAMVAALDTAAAEWEARASVDFVHLSQLDGQCDKGEKGVAFNVRQVTGGQYTAQAFFPHFSRPHRELLVDAVSFGNISPWTVAGVLKHELGHVLGFRHEHTRPEASPECFEDTRWRALTPYDPGSVMHYPPFYCSSGTNSGDWAFTELDALGAAAIYP